MALNKGSGVQGHHQYQPELFSQIDYENLIPKNHLLRRIDSVLDLSFLPELTKPLYSETQGRPSIAPEIFVRMVLLEYLYNINSDRQLCEEVGYNLAYRWFCKLSLKDCVPDHSSMTKIRDRLGEKVAAEIFNQILEQCKKAGLVKLNQVMVDGSTIKANASLYNIQEREENKKLDSNDDDQNPPATKTYAGQIYSKDGLSNNDLRKRNIEGKTISNKTHVSKSDPEATLAGKAFEAKSLQYKTHHAIDADSRVIIDCHVTTGNVSDITMFKERIIAVQNKLKQSINEVVADRGYGSGENLSYLEEQNIRSNIPLWSSRSGETFFKQLKMGFKVGVDGKSVHCPEGHKMTYSFHEESTGRDIFVLHRSLCKVCPRAQECLTEHELKNRGKRFSLINHFKIISEVHEKQKSPEFKAKLWERMWKMEGIFAEGKSFHGLRRARYRGKTKMQIQVYMISTVQNLKRLAGAVLDGIYRFILNFEIYLQDRPFAI